MKQRVEDKFKSGIYVILNKLNQKRYVGKAKNIYLRIKQHVTSLNTKCKDENIHLINSWHKYGRENFTYYVIEYINEPDIDKLEKLLSERELYWMKEFDSLNRENGYNIRYDSDGKCFVSEETKERMRESRIKYIEEHPEYREHLSKKSIEAHERNPEAFEKAKEKLAYANRKYKIAKCDRNGNIIKVYEIIKEISDENPEFYLQAIKGCCQGTKNTYKGFRWHYVDLETGELVLKGKFAK